MDLTETRPLDRYKRHMIDVVVDRFVVRHTEIPDDAPRDEQGHALEGFAFGPVRNGGA